MLQDAQVGVTSRRVGAAGWAGGGVTAHVGRMRVTWWLGMPWIAGMSLVGSQGFRGGSWHLLGDPRGLGWGGWWVESGSVLLSRPSELMVWVPLPEPSLVPLALSGTQTLHFDLGFCFVHMSLSPTGEEG